MHSRPLDTGFWTRLLGLFSYSARAMALVWQTSKALTFLLAGLTVVAGLLPGSIAWVGKQLIDAVVAADAGLALRWLGVEASRCFAPNSAIA
jgi:ATP-binding cassette subfamily B protein